MNRRKKRDTCKATEKEMTDVEAYPMRGGDGPKSYASNSWHQREVMNAAKKYVSEAILEKLDILKFSPSTTVRVADLGCSVGPNTFFAVQNILQAIELKCRDQGLNSRIPEFQVFFNDHISNDFNTLFSSLPPERRYHAAGVPGSFYTRLFPCHSLHLVHISYAIHWLSGVPKKVKDRRSPAWNKGRIFYTSAAEEVVEAYSAQCAEDMACLLQARAEEIADGGLMIITFPAHPDGVPHSRVSSNIALEMLASCLIDMAKKGTVSEEKVDMFNLPVYYISAQEVVAAVERNGCFSIERMESLPPIPFPEPLPSSTHLKAQATSFLVRAVTEGLIKAHFGEEILYELFDSYSKKLEQEFPAIACGESFHLCVVLKRKAIN